MTVPGKALKVIEFRKERDVETIRATIEWVEDNKPRIMIDHYENEKVEGKLIIRVYYRRRRKKQKRAPGGGDFSDSP